MAGNALEPGAGGLPSPSPEDQKANPPGPQLQMQPPSPPQGFQSALSAEDAAALQFEKIKTAYDQIGAMRRALDKLGALQDTVTMDDVVDAAGDIVAAGVPAAQVAGLLADVPQEPGKLQPWVTEMAQKLQPQEQKIAQAMKGARFDLGVAAMRGLLAHSAEDWHQKRLLAAAKAPGRMN